MTRRATVPPALVNAVLLAASLPVLARGRDRRRVVALLAAQQLRFGAAAAHQLVVERAYVGSTDVDEYDQAGRQIAQRLRRGRMRGILELARTVPWDTRLPGPVSTNLMRLLSGVVYAVVGPSRRSAFLVFSWVGFWGLYLFDRAFAIAVPAGRTATYSRLLFLLPSLSYWTSGMGKEAWMTLSLGTAAHGSARALTGSRGSGLAEAALGTAGAAAMRAQVGGRFGIALGSGIRDAGERSHLGESRFTPPALRSARDAPVVLASVLFRPSPLEAHNPQAALAAAEGTFLALLTLARARWALAALASAPRQPYAGVAAVAAAGLAFYLSKVANFGMLVRQRVALWPFYAVLLSIPPPGR